MDIVTAIQYVGTPIALIAFVIAAVAWSFQVKLKAKADLLEKLPLEQRESYLSKELESYQIDSAQKGVTGKEKVELMRLVIQQRLERLKVVVFAAVILAIILAIVIMVASLQGVTTTATNNSVGVSATGDSTVTIHHGDAK